MLWNDVEVPVVQAIELSRAFIGDRDRTAGGNLRQDIVTVKRQWQVRTGPMTKAQSDAFVADELEQKLWASGEFWIKEFGVTTNTVDAFIFAESLQEEFVQFFAGGVWQEDGRRLSFTVAEV